MRKSGVGNSESLYVKVWGLKTQQVTMRKCGVGNSEGLYEGVWELEKVIRLRERLRLVSKKFTTWKSGVWKVGKSLLRTLGVGGSEGHYKEILDVSFVEEFCSSDRRTCLSFCTG